MIDSAVALIPARGGSKGIPRKNLAKLGGKPLVAWTIEAAIEAFGERGVWLSSDDAEILRVGSEYGIQLIERPVELATDESRSEDVIQHFLSLLDLPDTDCQIITLLQPTSPFRTSKHIMDALSVFDEDPAIDSVVSVVQIEPSVLKSLIDVHGDGFLAPFSQTFISSPRQALPKTYMPNGAIYIFRKHIFLEKHKIYGSFLRPFVMSEVDSLDIDRPIDLKKAIDLL